MKYKIVLKAVSGDVFIEDETTSLNLIKDRRDIVDYVECPDNFAEYSDIDGLESGYMQFRFIDDELYTITEYISNRELNEKELEDLVEETQGQWSDGIGEGFEQHPCKYIGGKEVFVSPWFPGQKIEISQELIK